MNRKYLSVLMIVWQSLAWALDDDARQPIDIEADQVELDEKRQIGTYTGHVNMVQGSIHLNADTVIITGKGEKIVDITARGKPARFRQRPQGESVDVEAEAREVIYHASQSNVLLSGDAIMTQGKNAFRGEQIHYDMTANVVRANNGGDAKGRVHVTIDPTSMRNRKTEPKR